MYRKKEFEALISSINGLVSDLASLVPGNNQKELCKEDALKFTRGELHELLQALHEDGDKCPDKEFRAAIAARAQHENIRTTEFSNSSVGEGSDIRHGDDIAREYQGQILTGTSTVRMQNSEMGKNVKFDVGNKYGF